jgi:dolichol-phosphate mannosyltransferase
MKNLIIVIPTYNEEKNILKLTDKIHQYIPKCKILIIDDTKNSKLHKIFKKNNTIKFIVRKNKKGRGSAVLFGLKNAIRNKDNKIFIEMDADFSHKPSELNRNIKFFLKNKCDLLIASRYLANSKIENWSIQRRIFSKLANLLAQLFLQINVTDYTNGYRIYSKVAVKKIIKDCGKIGDGFIVLSEILLKIHQSKLKIMEIDSFFINRTRGESSVNFSLILQSLFGLFKLFLIKFKKNLI